MTLRIEIELENDAFDHENYEEVERILTDLLTRLPLPVRPTEGALSLHDANGNWTGKAEITRR